MILLMISALGLGGLAEVGPEPGELISLSKTTILKEEVKKYRTLLHRRKSCEKMARYLLLLFVLEESVSLTHYLKSLRLYQT